MTLKTQGPRNARSRNVRQWRWGILAASVFAFYCMFQCHLLLWSMMNLHANVVKDTTRPVVPRKIEESLRIIKQDTVKPPALIDLQLNASSDKSVESVDVVKQPQQLRTAAHGSTASLPPRVAPANVPFALRHDVVSGYEATIKYLANYTTPENSTEALFLFFVCGDDQGQQTDWKQICVDATRVVYDVFRKSPSRNRLLTIHAGSAHDWSVSNAFHRDGDLKVKMIPAIMQWHGGTPGAKRATSRMIVDTTLLYEPLLRYLFKSEDVPDPLLAPNVIATKELVVLKGYKSYKAYMDTMAAGTNASVTVPTGPLFLFFSAGRLKANDRPWCPYCRYSELPVEYAFYAFAPQGARLVKVETVDSYKIWKSPANEWRQDTDLMIRGVPWMYGATFDPNRRAFSLVRYQVHFASPLNLRGVFQAWNNPLTGYAN